MSIREKENDLSDRWRKSLKDEEISIFVQDGTLDPEAYSSSNLKICSILKEVPDDKSGFYIFNISDRLDRGNGKFYLKRADTLRNLARWISLIRKTLIVEKQPINDTEFFPHPLVDKQHIKDLFESAYMNNRKYNGNIFSVKSDLDSIARKDKMFLREQINEILKPKIIITGGTFSQYKILTEQELTLIVEKNPIKIWSHSSENGIRLIFDLYHPLFTNINHKSYFSILHSALEELKITSHFNEFRNESIC